MKCFSTCNKRIPARKCKKLYFLRSQTLSYRNCILQVTFPAVTITEIGLFVILVLVIELLIRATRIINFIIIKNNRI